MLSLDMVTLVSVNCLNPKQSIKALEYSYRDIKFKEILLLTDQHIKHETIKVQTIPPIDSITKYNKFCITYLKNFICTDFCLIVQPDGFVLNSDLWNKDFLNYDYIGAPWNKFHSAEALNRIGALPYFMDYKKIPFVVGNGGFSLRSKKILDEISKLHLDNFNIPEDNVYSVFYRKEFKEKSIKIAPVNLAYQFSLEHFLENLPVPTKTFGFHGKLPHLIEFNNIIATA